MRTSHRHHRNQAPRSYLTGGTPVPSNWRATEGLQSEGTPGVDDGIAMVERLLGLPGMNVLEVAEGDDELVVTVETNVTVG